MSAFNPSKPSVAAETEKSGPASLPARAQPLSLISDDLKHQAIETLADCMRATRRFWDKDAKAFVAEPDYATRIRSAELTLAYAEGRPVERKFELRGNVETFEDRKKELMKSPEGVRFLLAARAISDGEAADALASIVKTSQE